MIPQYTEEEFNNAKSDDKLKLKCEECGEIFYKRKWEIARVLRDLDNHGNDCRFCCHACSNKHRKVTDEQKARTSKSMRKYYESEESKERTPMRVCPVCGKEFRYHRGEGTNTRKCCCKKCSDYFNEHEAEFLTDEARERISRNGRLSVAKQGDARRSKAEIFFFMLCLNYFGADKVLNNVPMFNGWDADIIIPSLKIAILYNGAWHSKEISKKISLAMIQNRDRIKIKEIEACGYSVYIINDPGAFNEEFVRAEFDKFIEYANGKQDIGVLEHAM